MHTNSSDSFYQFIEEGKMSRRAIEVIEAYRGVYPSYLTDREIKQRLRRADMNEVRPIITRMFKMGLLEESTERRYDPFTNRKVRALRLTQAGYHPGLFSS